MRSIAVLTGGLAITTWFAIHALPRGDVHAANHDAVTHEVASLSIDGQGLPLARLRGVIGTRIGSIVDPVQLASDRAALQDWLESHGYLAATVESPVVTFGATGGAFVVFDIQTGPLFHVRSVALEGDPWSDAVVTIMPGDEASSDRIASARLAAETAFERRGVPREVELVVRSDRDDAAVDVTFVAR